MTTKDWTMAGIFADEGITGTKAKKRPEFLRMIEMCKRKKIDLILTKSISRFARNTLDCLKYIRELKEQGIGVYFEEQNINTLDAGQELFLTIYGAFAQAESENISANVRWGQRQAMRQGRVRVRWGQLYGFEKGEDGEGRVIPEQAEVVQRIYREFLAGASIRMIVNSLEADQIPNKAGEVVWHKATIRSILMYDDTLEFYLDGEFLQEIEVKAEGSVQKVSIPLKHALQLKVVFTGPYRHNTYCGIANAILE